MPKIQKSILILVLVVTILSVFPVQAQQNNLFCLKSSAYNHQLQMSSSFNTNFSEYNIIYQNLKFKVDPSVYFIEGAVSIYYQANQMLDSLVVNLSDSLNVDSITQNSLALGFLHFNNLLKIDIEDISALELDSITIYYRGEPTHQNKAFFIGVQDSINYIPVLATLSEPYGASDWWPCKNTLTDKIDSIDISINCPAGNIGVSLGLLKNVEHTATRNIYHWRHRYPVAPYLVSIAVSDYYEYHSYIQEVNNDSLLFLNYLYQNNLEDKKSQIDRTGQFMRLYDSLFVRYPFAAEKYGHVEFPIAGGMEHQTISSMGMFDYEIISHELAHQWFGDYITCGSWEDLWLNEGFATYCTGLCYENIGNGYWWPLWKEVTLSKITADSSGTVFPVDTSSFSVLFNERLTYRKAAYLLHMIRWTVGDSIFFQSIRDYLNDSDLSFSYARTPNLIAHFEQEADTSLSAFMNDWFYGEGYPMYNIDWTQDENQKIHFQIHQESALNDHHFFRLYVPLRLVGNGDTLDIRLNNQTNHQDFEMNLDFEVDTVIFDPLQWLISKNSIISQNIRSISHLPIKIFPNPTSRFLTIYTDLPIENYEIFGASGQRFSVPTHGKTIDLGALKQGVYILRVKVDKQVFIKKIIKKKLP